MFSGLGVIRSPSVEVVTPSSSGTACVPQVGSGLRWSEQLHIWLCHSFDRPPPSSSPPSPFNTCPAQFPPFSPQPPQPRFLRAQSLANTPIHTSSHTFSLLKSEKAPFQRLPCNISLPRSAQSGRWGRGRSSLSRGRTKLSAKVFFFTCNGNGCWRQSQKPERQLYSTVQRFINTTLE